MPILTKILHCPIPKNEYNFIGNELIEAKITVKLTDPKGIRTYLREFFANFPSKINFEESVFKGELKYLESLGKYCTYNCSPEDVGELVRIFYFLFFYFLFCFLFFIFYFLILFYFYLFLFM